MKVLRLNPFSTKVYGVADDGQVFVARSDALLCELPRDLAWRPVAADKVPVTLSRWMESA